MTSRRVRAVLLLTASAVLLVLNRVTYLFPVARPRGDHAYIGGALAQYLAVAGIVLGVALLRRRETPCPHGRVRPAAWILLALGVVAIACYAVLGALDTGIGAPTDIGGGLIPLGAYVLTGIGIVMAVEDRDDSEG